MILISIIIMHKNTRAKCVKQINCAHFGIKIFLKNYVLLKCPGCQLYLFAYYLTEQIDL